MTRKNANRDSTIKCEKTVINMKQTNNSYWKLQFPVIDRVFNDVDDYDYDDVDEIVILNDDDENEILNDVNEIWMMYVSQQDQKEIHMFSWQRLLHLLIIQSNCNTINLRTI